MSRWKKIFLIALTSVILINSCSKDPATNATNNLNGNVISAFGHAGMGIAFKYPVDSYESIEPCLRIGSDGSEIDIQMTKDSVLVAYHPSLLQEGTLCNGYINDNLWSDIWGCHHASPYSSKIDLMSVSNLFGRLETVGYNLQNFIFTFDCKLYTSSSDQNSFLNHYANAILKIMDEKDLQNNILIESQDTIFLRMLQNKRSGLKLFIYPAGFDDGLAIAKKMGLFGISTHNDYISSDQIKIAHDNGLRITLWGVHTHKDDINAISKSPDYIQSDKIIHLLKVFGKYKHNINKGEGG